MRFVERVIFGSACCVLALVPGVGSVRAEAPPTPPIFCGIAPPAKSPSPSDGKYAVSLTGQLTWDGGEGRDCITVPPQVADSDADGNNIIPFNGSMHYQQVYDASLFSHGGTITGIRFRMDVSGGAAISDSGSWLVDVKLGYSLHDSSSLSPTFAENRAPGQITVFSNPTTFTTTNTGVPAREFDFVLPMEGTFDYDPALGPLLLEMTATGPASLGAYFDAASGAGMARLFADTLSATGSGGQLGLVTEFCFDGGNTRSRATRFGVIGTSGNGASTDPQGAVIGRLARLTQGAIGATVSWGELDGFTAAELRERYDVIYFPGDAVQSDFDLLAARVADGGLLEQYTALGGVLVVVASNSIGNESPVAPGGVGYTESPDNATFVDDPAHPFITGRNIRGASLAADALSNWSYASTGYIAGIPAVGSKLIASNTTGPVLAEYRHGEGTVIVTGMTIGWDISPDGEYYYQGPAFTNLLRLAAERSQPARIGVLDNAQFNFPAVINALDTLRLLPGVRGARLPWSAITPGTASGLRQRYDAILFSGSASPTDTARLQTAVANGGVLDVYAKIGGSLDLIVSTSTVGTQADIAPGGVDYTLAFHEAETLSSSSFYVNNGVAEGSFLTADQFTGWNRTDHGTLSSFPPVDISVVTANADGPSMVEYAWGRGHVLVTSLTTGWIGAEPYNGEPFKNLLRLAGFKGRRGACPTLYNVYFGTVDPPSATLAYESPGEGFDPGLLEADTTYYWQVTSVRENSGIGGNVWTFSTALSGGRGVGDFDSSGCTDITDFLFLLDYWNIVSPLGGAPIDINDFLALLDYWNTGPAC